VDHLVIPLDGYHVHALTALTRAVAAACGAAMAAADANPHVTLVEHTALIAHDQEPG
jgi:hypothetical protein